MTPQEAMDKMVEAAFFTVGVSSIGPGQLILRQDENGEIRTALRGLTSEMEEGRRLDLIRIRPEKPVLRGRYNK